MRWLQIFVLWCCAIATASAGAPRKVMSLSYSPSGISTMAALERGIPEAHLRRDLERLAPFTTGIRLYSLEYGLDRVPAIARALCLNVSLGIWLGKDRDKNAAAISKGIAVISANTDVIDRVFVGNEAIVRGDLPAAAVVDAVQQVKAALGATRIPISTGEPWHVWLEHPELAEAADFIGAHFFGYWDGVDAADAVPYLDRLFDQLQTRFPAKAVVIAETGWPTGGAVNQAAIPSPAARAGYVRAFLRRATERHYAYNIVEAYDQPWKAPDEKSAVWGLLTDDGAPTFAFFAP
jgi:exo-beta-1,3-glucanase (GH17 family)